MYPQEGTSRTTGVTLSPTEQRIYLHALPRRVVTTREMIRAYGNERAVRKALVGVKRKGYALQVIRGLYGAVPPEHVGKNYEIDRYLIAQSAGGSGGAIGYHSALELHGVANASLSTIYYLTIDRIASFTFQDVDYRFVATEVAFGTTQIIRQGIPVTVTDRERTILDCIRRPDLAGGLEEILKGVGTFHTLDSAVIGKYLGLYDEKSLMQRTGVILSLLRKQLRVPGEFLASLRKGLGRKVYYLTPDMRKGTGSLDREWNVMVPKNIDEVMQGV